MTQTAPPTGVASWLRLTGLVRVSDAERPWVAQRIATTPSERVAAVVAAPNALVLFVAGIVWLVLGLRVLGAILLIGSPTPIARAWWSPTVQQRRIRWLRARHGLAAGV